MDRQSQAMNRVASECSTPHLSSQCIYVPALTSDMLASKAGAPKVSLKLLFKDDLPAGGLHFTFTNPTVSSREDDRKTVQDILIPFVSINKGITPLPGAIPTPGAASTSTPGTPAAVAGIKRRLDGETAAPSPASSQDGGTPVDPAKKVKNSVLNSLRGKVLRKNPTLAALHHELVVSPDDPTQRISEREFWEGREVS